MLLSAATDVQPTFRIARLGTSAAITSSRPVGITPVRMRHFYGIDSINLRGKTGDGSGQTIAIVDAYHDPSALSDLKSFDAAFGLPDPPAFQQFDQLGGTNFPTTDPAGPGTQSWEVEESLDIEWAHAIAPAADIDLVEADAPDTSDFNQATATAADLPGVVAVSMSFGSRETSNESSQDSTFTTPAGHQGVTFLAATGDNGAPGGYPAYSPNVVAVGGTTVQMGTDGTYLGETGWSGSGGGFSRTSFGTPFEPEPAYQRSVQNTGRRSTPDVSMDADPQTGVAIYDSYDFGTASPWTQIGGTSLATPMWAALIAIADQGRAIVGLASLDGPTQTLPKLYSISSADFHDITVGSNGKFSAGPGYDEVTGLGSPVGDKLVNDLAGVPPAASVVGRYIFYNNSAFDGHDPAANSNDDQATATDKQALLPGTGPATFANYSSYLKGINGIIIDVAGPVGTPIASDFSFLEGNSTDVTTWTAAPAPSAVLVRPAAGVNGSTRIEITWPDGVIRNTWLQITVNADASTGLAVPDVFYFGNLVGQGGENPTIGQFEVTAADELTARNDPHGLASPAVITDPLDFDRDGKVNVLDQLIARYSAGDTLAVIDPVAASGALMPQPAAPAAISADTLVLKPRHFKVRGPYIR